MIFKGIEICCPACRGDLAYGDPAETELRCADCGRCYPVILSIPDLRLYPDPYIGMEADRAKGQRVAAQADRTDFAGLVDYYYSITPAVTAPQAEQFTRGLLGGVARSQAVLDGWQAMGNGRRRGALLDLGCGTGPLLVAAESQYEQMVGVDIAFRWLVVGQKRLAEAGLDLPLICACAEALPFPDGAFDDVAAESVLELVTDQPRTLSEARRVLRANGRLMLTTPNRYSLGPDPHVGLLAGGWLPESWLAAYVRRQGGVPPVRSLLSAGRLRRLLRQAGFTTPQVALPDVPPGQRQQFSGLMRMAIDGYRLARRLPLSRQLLLLIGPLLQAVARKTSHQ